MGLKFRHVDALWYAHPVDEYVRVELTSLLQNLPTLFGNIQLSMR